MHQYQRFGKNGSVSSRRIASLITIFAFLVSQITFPLPLPIISDHLNREVAYADVTNSITQYGITWTFDQEYEYGQYVNGDYWVVGPVTVTSITPAEILDVVNVPSNCQSVSQCSNAPSPYLGQYAYASYCDQANAQCVYTAERNGWMVNPTTTAPNGFDSRAGVTINGNLTPSLPYVAEPGESIIKSISRNPLDASCRPCLDITAVLTVVSAPPVTNSFRPNFFGPEKASYTTDDLHLDLLPSIPPPSGALPSFSDIVNRFKMMQYDIDSYPGENLRASQNFCFGDENGTACSYGGRVALALGDAILRLMLNDPLDDKREALVHMTQVGIDYYHMMMQGIDWEANGGHGSGRKLSAIFTSILLDNQTWKNEILSRSGEGRNVFQEDGFLYYGQPLQDGTRPVLFGEGTGTYWLNQISDGGSRTARDPYDYVDANIPGTSYQAGINSMIWKGPVIAMQLMPEISDIWNNPLFLKYVDRWVTFGAWAQDDPCAPVMGVCVGGANDGQQCTYAQRNTDGLDYGCPDGLCTVGICNGGEYAGLPCGSWGVDSGPSPNNDCGTGTCNLYNPAYWQVTFGPDPSNPGHCIQDADPSDGIGRHPYRHGQSADTGTYQSAFVNAMWDEYRLYHCLNGVQDQDEEGIDCGGSCIYDLDGDGAYRGICNHSDSSYDCNDENPLIHPGAVEICVPTGEYDDDCDGQMHDSYYEDTDLDQVNNCEDNCLLDCNTDQADLDGDGIGDACDSDFSLLEDFESRQDGNLTERRSPNGMSFEIVSGSASIGSSTHWDYNSRYLYLPGTADPINLTVTQEGRNEWSNYALDLIVGQKYTTGGLAFHYQNSSNYYLLNLRSGKVEKVENGSTTEIDGAGDSIIMPWGGANANYEVTVTTDSSVTFVVTKDGVAARTFTDSNPHVTRGSIGFFERGHSSGNYFIFDNIHVVLTNDYDGPHGSCVPEPNCTDGIQNGDEEGIDCGGSCPNSCAVNQPPIVSAGTDQEITLPTESVTLTGSITDDGLPNPPGVVTVAWSQIGGPVNTLIQNPDSQTTQVFGLTTPGTYTYLLNADDDGAGENEPVSDDVVITVNAAPSDQCSNGSQDGDEEGVDCGGSCPHDCHAYFVDKDAVGGYACSDSGTGRISTPWCTIQKALDAAQAGDTINVRQGTYRDVGVDDPNRGKILARFKSDGAPGEPITVKSFNGEQVILDGSDLMSGWQPCTSQEECLGNSNWQQMYVAQAPVGTTAESAFLREGDSLLIAAQDPNPLDWQYYTNPRDNWILTPAENYTLSTIADPNYFTQLDPNYWVGHYIMVWSCNNNVFTNLITAYDPALHMVTFDPPLPCEGFLDPGTDRYSLWNHPSLIDQAGEYYVDELNGRIYLWPLDAQNLDQIKIGIRQKGFDLRGHDHLVIDGFILTGFTGGMSHGAIDNYNFGTGFEVSDVTVKNNYIHDVKGGSILISGANNVTADHNRIYRTLLGRGIHLSGGENSVISNNHMERNGRTGYVFYGIRHGQIINNVNIDSQGEHSNAITTYLECDDVLVADNTVINSKIAYTFQSSINITARNNIFVDGGISGWSGGYQDGDPYNVLIENNTLISETGGSSINVNSQFQNVTIRDNIAGALTLASNHSNNLFLDEPSHDLSQYQESYEPNQNILFVNRAEHDYRLLGGFVGDPLVDMCTMASDGTHVGALPCVGCLDEMPIALFTVSAFEGIEDLTVDFDATASRVCGQEPGLQISNYHWDFGDGEVVEGADRVQTSHVYHAGVHHATLTVTDDLGRESHRSVEIRVRPVEIPNVILRYDFNDHVHDVSGQDFHGEWLDADRLPAEGSYSNGVFAHAGVFENNLHVLVPNAPELRGMERVTFSIWAKKSAVDGRGYIFSKHGHYNINLINGNAVFSLSASNESQSVSVSDPQDTEWHHYAMTYDSTTLSAYLDGTLVGTALLTGPVRNETYDSWAHRVGAAGSGATNPFMGLIDEYRVYNIALTSDEIALLATPPPPNTPPQVNAGSDVDVTLPTTTATLNGSVTDDGFPNPPGAVVIGWIQTGGPVNATIESSNSAVTNINGLTRDGVYAFQLSADDDTNDQVPAVTDEVVVTVIPEPPSPPVAPSNLETFNPTRHSMELRWVDNSDNEENFILERSARDNSNFQALAPLAPDTTSFTDSDLTAGTLYFYRIKAVNSSGESTYSNEASGTTQAEDLCANGVQDPGEDGIDCGGDCPNACNELLFQDDFEDGNYDQIDPNLTNGMSWQLVQGHARVDANKITNRSLGLTSESTTVLSNQDITAQEFTLSQKVLVVWSSPSKIYFLYQDAANYYFIGIAGGSKGLFRVMDGVETKLSDPVYDAFFGLTHSGGTIGSYKIYVHNDGSQIQFKVDKSGYGNGTDFDLDVLDSNEQAAARFRNGKVGYADYTSTPSGSYRFYTDDVAVYQGLKLDQRPWPVSNFYVNGVTGDDAFPGTEAEPWKTIQKAASTMLGGDTALIASGIYREDTIALANSGKEDAPITFKAQDGNNKPLILGSGSRAGQWESYQGNIFKATIDWIPPDLYQNNILMFHAQDPNQVDPEEPMDRDYFMTVPEVNNNNGNNNSELIDENYFTQNDSNFWVGAKLLLYDRQINATQTITITGYDPALHKIMFDPQQWVRVDSQDKYALRNHMSLLDQAGEWYLNTSATPYELYVWPYDGMSIDDVEIPKQSTAFNLSSGYHEHMVFDGLEMKHFTGSALIFSVQSGSSRYGLVTNCRIHHNGSSGVAARFNAEHLIVKDSALHHNFGNGISFAGGSQYLAQGNEVYRNLDNGIWMGNGGPELYYVTDVLVRNNYIHDHSSNRTHPDNIQSYKANNITVDGNLFVQTGHQNTWFEANGNLTFTNNIVIDGVAGVNNSKHAYVVNNVFKNSTVRFDAHQGDFPEYETEEAIVRNNAVIDSGLTLPAERQWPGFEIDHNFYSIQSSNTFGSWANNIGLGEGSIVNPNPGDPNSFTNYFVDALANDFHHPVDGLLIDTGSDVTEWASIDKEGQNRYQGVRVDIGPFESSDDHSFQDCTNGVQDSGEEGVDCGGICAQDFDGDGYQSGLCLPNPNLDCNDENFSVHPGAEELCDGSNIDYNCDGELHPGYNQDSDQDTVNNCSDNCVNDSNVDQADFDEDRIGDVCDAWVTYIEDFELRFNGTGDLSDLKRPNGLSWEFVSGEASVSAVDGGKIMNLPGNAQDGSACYIISREGRNQWQNFSLDLDISKNWSPPNPGFILLYKDAANFYFFNVKTGQLFKRDQGVDSVVGSNAALGIAHADSTMHHYKTNVSYADGALSFEFIKDQSVGPFTFTDPTPHATAGSIGILRDPIVNSNGVHVDNINLTVSSDIVFTNHPPQVSAGDDLTVTLPDQAALDGTVTDDGLPNPPGALVIEWSQVSGPGNTTFGNANMMDATASFSQDGIYVLRLSADDDTSDQIPAVTDDVIVTVEAGNCAAGEQREVSQYGITWTFDNCHPVGQFANGDYWVVGPVVITGMTPEYGNYDLYDRNNVYQGTPTMHGWEVNPRGITRQGFDSRNSNFNPDLVPALPYTAQPGQSVVKGYSLEASQNGNDTRYMDCRPCLQTAAVLTVLAEVPPNQGATILRPPYTGDDKPLYSIDDIHWDKLPSYNFTSSNVPTLETIQANFQRVQLDHIHSQGGVSELIHPEDNMPFYGGDIGLRAVNAALRFMLNDSNQQKLPAVINYLENGLDLYGAMMTGGEWIASGGHGAGRKMPITMAAILLDNQAMKDNILARTHASPNIFSEDADFYYNRHDRRAVYGQRSAHQGDNDAAHADQYWRNLIMDQGHRLHHDPHEWIDGGQIPGGSYQAQIGGSRKPVAIALHMMPELKQLWDLDNNKALMDFEDRWVNFGAWSQPDACAPIMGVCIGGPNSGQVCTFANNDPNDGAINNVDCAGSSCGGGICEPGSPNQGQPCYRNPDCGGGDSCYDFNPNFYKVTYGPDPNNFLDCIPDANPADGMGRYPQRHAMNRDHQHYSSRFANDLWPVFRPLAPEGSCIDQVDGDYDTFTDCADPDCASDVACLGTCRSDGECSDSLYCNGDENCVNNVCQAGASPCSQNQTCDEANDQCLNNNQPPQVSAGSDVDVTLPATTATLNGVVSDDGLPNPPGALVIEWVQIGGPVNAVIETPNSAVTNISRLTQAGTYTFQLSADDDGNGPNLPITDDVVVTVNDLVLPPQIIQQPEDQTVPIGSSVTFSVTATGSDPLNYQWRKDGSDIPSANSASHTIQSAQPEDMGNYDVVVSNSAGTITSNTAVLTVNSGGGLPIYVDGSLTQDCRTGNYSIANRNCTGTDGNAYNRIQEAANVVNPGQTIFILGGVFPEGVVISRSGISGNVITIRGGFGGGETVIDGGDVRSNAMQVYGGNGIPVEYVDFSDLTLQHSTDEGLEVVNGHYLNFNRIISKENGSHGSMWKGFSAGGSHDITVRNSFFFRNGLNGKGVGMRIGDRADHYVYNMLVEDTVAHSNCYPTGVGAELGCETGAGININSPENLPAGTTHDITLRRVLAYNNGSTGISTQLPYNVLVEDSIAFDNNVRQTPNGEGYGFRMAFSGLNQKILRSISFHNKRTGIQFEHITNGEVYNSIAFNNSWGGVHGGFYAQDPITAENNIAYQNSIRDFDINVASSSHNFIGDGIFPTGEQNSLTGNPQFLNLPVSGADFGVRTCCDGNGQEIPGNDLATYQEIYDQLAGQFGLQPSSQAINAGLVVSNYHCAQSDDVDPNQTSCSHWSGSAPDIGVFEYMSGNPPNRVPQVSAGSDVEITLPATSATLNGSVTDDGLPNPPGALVIEWVQIGGPVNAVIETPNSAVTNISRLTQAGTYTFQLSADDDGNGPNLPITDDVVVTVNGEQNTCNPIYYWSVGGENPPINLTSYPLVRANTSGNDASLNFFNCSPQSTVGRWPGYVDGSPINGGLPQLGDLQAHLAAFEASVIAQIPDPNWAGYAVIDFETWHPIWERNRGHQIYIDESKNLVRQAHPDWTDEQIEAQAKLEWESAARQYFEQTVLRGKQLRPNGKWGYYSTPDRIYYSFQNFSEGDPCFAYGIGYTDCQRAISDRMNWLWQAVDVLYPSIYQFFPSGIEVPLQDNEQYVRSMMQESVRLAGNAGGREIVPYTWSIYHNSGKYHGNHLIQEDERLSYSVPVEYGVQGIVLWSWMGGFGDFVETTRQENNFLQSTQGPYLTQVDNQRCGVPAPHVCSDGLDNDGDDLFDYPADPGCASRDDDDENHAVVIPQAPTNLTLTALSATDVYLHWTDASNDEVGLLIERKQESGNFIQIPYTVTSNITQYFDRGLNSGGYYTYRIRAFNTAGYSGYSNEVSMGTQNEDLDHDYYSTQGGGNVCGVSGNEACNPGIDCDDRNIAIHPNAAEICDQLDNNCDGQVDEIFDLNQDSNNCGSCGVVCGDSDLCNGAESCESGICVSQNPIDCSDSVACTDDICNPADGSCSHVANNNLCGANQICDSAAGCISSDFCSAHADGTPCDDNLFCTVGEICTGGQCSGGNLKDCSSAGDQCHIGICDEGQDLCVPQNGHEGDVCDDGNLCTSGETCSAGQCGNGITTDCSALSDQCNAGVCEPSTGACMTEPVTDGTSCDDTSVCTSSDSCHSGVCLGVQVADCVVCSNNQDCQSLNSVCREAVCNLNSGLCELSNRPDGTSCTDSNLCNGSETCQSGICASGNVVDCDDANACTQDACDPTSGQCLTSSISCDDNEPCSLDSCDSVLGCQHDRSQCTNEQTPGNSNNNSGSNIGTPVSAAGIGGVVVVGSGDNNTTSGSDGKNTLPDDALKGNLSLSTSQNDISVSHDAAKPFYYYGAKFFAESSNETGSVFIHLLFGSKGLAAKNPVALGAQMVKKEMLQPIKITQQPIRIEKQVVAPAPVKDNWLEKFRKQLTELFQNLIRNRTLRSG